MENGGRVVWTFDADTGKFYREVDQATGKVKDMADEMDNADRRGSSSFSSLSKVASNLGSSLADTAKTVARVGFNVLELGATAAGAAMTTLAVKGLQSANGLQSLQLSMDGLTHSMQLGALAMAGAYEYAQKAPFQLPDVAGSVKTLIAFGMTAQDAVKQLDLLGNISITTGFPIQALAGIFGQVSAQGKLMLGDIRQLTEDGVAILPALQKQLGKTAEQVQDMATRGEISFTQFRAAMETIVDPKILDLLNNTMPRQLDRLGGSIRRVSNAFVGVNVDAVNGFTMASNGIDQAATTLIKTLADTLRSPDVINAAGSVGNALVPLINGLTKLLVPIITGFAKLAENISQVGAIAIPILGLMVSGVGSLANQIPILGQYLGFLEGPLGIILGLFGGIVASSPELRAGIGGAFKSIQQALAPLQPVLGTIAQLFTQIATQVGNALVPVVGAIASLLIQLMTALAPLIPVFLNLVVILVNALAPIFAQLAQTVGPILVQTLIDIAPALVSIAQSLVIILPPLAELLALFLQLSAKAIEVGARLVVHLAPALVLIAKGAAILIDRFIMVGVWMKHLADSFRSIGPYAGFKDVIKAVALGLLVAVGAYKAYIAVQKLGTGIFLGSTLLQQAYAVSLTETSVAAKIATVAQWAFNGALAFLTSPLVLIVAGIAAVVAILYLLNERFNLVGKGIAFVKDGIAAAQPYLDTMKQWFGDAAKFMGDLVKGAMADIVQWAKDAAQFTADLVKGAFADLKQWFKDVKKFIDDVSDAYNHNAGNLKIIADTIGIIVLPALAKMVTQATWAATQMVIQGARAAAGWAIQKAGEAWGWITEMAVLVKDAAIKAAQIAVSGAQAAWAWTVAAPGKAWGWITETALLVKDAAVKAALIAWSGIQAAAGWVFDGFSWLFNLAKVAAASLATAASVAADGIAGAAGWIAGAASSAAAWVVARVSMIVGAVADAIVISAAGLTAAAGWIAGAVAAGIAWLIALGPIIIIVGAIVLAVAVAALLIIKYWDDIKNFAIAAWNWILGAVQGVWNWIQQNWPLLLAIITGPIGIAVYLIINYWNQIKAGAAAVFGFIQSVASSVGGWIASVFNSAKDRVIGAFGAVVSWFSGLQGRILGAIGDAGSWLAGVGGKIIDGLVNGIKNGFGKVKSTLGDLTKKIADWKGPLSVDKKLLVPNANIIMGGLVKGLESNYGTVRKSLQGFTDSLGGNIDVGVNTSSTPAIGNLSSKDFSGAGNTSTVENHIGTITIASDVDADNWLKKLTRQDEINMTGLTA